MEQKVKIFISFDLEGVTIVSSWREAKKDAPSCAEIRRCATDEVCAAVQGARRGSPGDCEIVICDAHAQGENLIVEKLPKGIRLVKGSPREFYMVEGIDKSFDLLFCIGYHAMAGTLGAGMDHTYSSSILYSVKINGVPEHPVTHPPSLRKAHPDLNGHKSAPIQGYQFCPGHLRPGLRSKG